MSYTIEKNHQVPERSARSKYPFAQMQVGDSFLVTDEGERRNVQGAATRYGDATGTRFITRTRNETTDGENGVRVWRVDPEKFPRRTRKGKSEVAEEGNVVGF